MVKDLQAIPYQTQRRLIRYPLCPPADVYMLDGGVQRRLQLSQMLNISAGGACVVSECAYDMGQPLCLRIKFTRDGPYSVYQCRVVRITPRRGGFFEYGLLFTHMDKSARDGLLMNLHTIQENTEKKLLP